MRSILLSFDFLTSTRSIEIGIQRVPKADLSVPRELAGRHYLDPSLLLPSLTVPNLDSSNAQS